jgi:hypothetical protein
VNTFIIVAQMCVEALAREQEKLEHASSVQAIWSSVNVYWQRTQMSLVVWLFSMHRWGQSELPQTSRVILDALKWASSFFASPKGAPENETHRRALRSRRPATNV